jgi:hypothetical protein
MLNRDQLAELYQELRHERVLSVYLDGKTNDFSQRNLWRKRLEHGVSEARKRLNGVDPSETRAFEDALVRIEEELSGIGPFLPDHGWVGFATRGRLVSGHSVRVPMPDLVRWEDGIRVAPYVRALKQDRVVIAVLVDSRRARLFEYRDAVLVEPQSLFADSLEGEVPDLNVSKRATGHSGVRGKTATDAAQRYLDVESDRMMKRLVEVVAERIGSRGLLVIGGTQEAVAAVKGHLPASLKDRTIERSTAGLEISEADVRKLLESAASELNQSLQAELLGEVVNHARSGGRGALGPEAVAKALEEGRVDTLLLTRSFIRGDAERADRFVGAAFERHGEVEELSGGGAERLDRAGEGVAARLRYVLEN